MKRPVAYKIVPTTDREAATEFVPFAPVDVEDGYMHMSTIDTVEATANKHFKGKPPLTIMEIDLSRISDLRWEKARGGQLFPHAYTLVPLSAVLNEAPLPETETGFAFPDWVTEK